MTYHARVTSDGRLILPDELAAELDLQPGGSVAIEREDGKLVLKSFGQIIRDSQARFRAMLPADATGSLVDELIADRRAEARREDDEHAEWLKRPRAE